MLQLLKREQQKNTFIIKILKGNVILIGKTSTNKIFFKNKY